jgi:2-methylfumaryl-CoA isomerase
LVFERIETPGVGEHLAAGSAVRVGDEHRQPTRPAPPLGAQTDEVLHEVLGLPGAEIGRLHNAGIVAGTKADRTARSSKKVARSTHDELIEIRTAVGTVRGSRSALAG